MPENKWWMFQDLLFYLWLLEVQFQTTKAHLFCGYGIPISKMTGTTPEALKCWKTFI